MTSQILFIIPDEEPPRLTNCTSEVTFQDTGLGPTGDLGIDEEEWNNSQFNDNSGTLSNELLGVPSGSMFPLGETEVVSRVTDPSGNTQDCNVTIRVSSKSYLFMNMLKGVHEVEGFFVFNTISLLNHYINRHNYAQLLLSCLLLVGC